MNTSKSSGVGEPPVTVQPVSELGTGYAQGEPSVAKLLGALADIADPIAAWRRDLPEGHNLNGAAAIAMANDPQTYRRMAREAIASVDDAMANPPLLLRQRNELLTELERLADWASSSDYPIERGHNIGKSRELIARTKKAIAAA